MNFKLNLLFVFLFLFIASSLKANELENEIIGKWAEEKDPMGFVVFNSNGTYEEFLSANFIKSGTWSVVGNAIVIVVSDSPYWDQTVEVTHPVIRYENAKVLDGILSYKTQEGIEMNLYKFGYTNSSSDIDPRKTIIKYDEKEE